MKNRKFTWLSGFGLGMGVMYLFDPEKGRKRQAYLRDQFNHLAHRSANMAKLSGQDLVNRTIGILSESRAALFGERSIPDSVIEDRVRSKLGRIVSHPHAVEVFSEDGNVILKGLIFNNELDPLISKISLVRGVKSVRNELEPHRANENIAALQGGTQRGGDRLDIFQVNWSPATRALVGFGGITLGAFGLRRKGGLGPVLAGMGLLAVARSLTNMELKRLIGLGAKRREISFRKTAHIQASIESVYKFWSNFENFPKFMREIKEVRIAGNGVRSHWIAQGPLGAPVSWDAEITRNIPNQLISWRSVPGSLIQNAGRIKFMPSELGGTKIELDFTYNPPAGALGHTLAKLFGSDPKRRIEMCLVELKQLLEAGPSPRQLRALSS